MLQCIIIFRVDPFDFILDACNICGAKHSPENHLDSLWSKHPKLSLYSFEAGWYIQFYYNLVHVWGEYKIAIFVSIMDLSIFKKETIFLGLGIFRESFYYSALESIICVNWRWHSWLVDEMEDRPLQYAFWNGSRFWISSGEEIQNFGRW